MDETLAPTPQQQDQARQAQGPPIVSRTFRCTRCGLLAQYDVEVLSTSSLHSSPALGGEKTINCSHCTIPLEITYRPIEREPPPEPERDRSWIEKAERSTQSEEAPARSTPEPTPV
jgi:hypothetical protein